MAILLKGIGGFFTPITTGANRPMGGATPKEPPSLTEGRRAVHSRS
ncbi:uncharacterized protein SOCE26_017560 [Sorangium cellulosum]|uniref:Uncharacterized protein n=1 Tax=Sorangium cellulosum TaxID=56 RepID=A0A2L0EM30_SORCE|nr:hypothetical protein [Sorangium cellulosum]AUX40356.1 uncharacterized protein SOCE26_017560 [Sorangium cellulosum]